MKGYEISVWIDERWCDALKEDSGGWDVEDLVQRYLDHLIRQLPDQVREPIEAEICAEKSESLSSAETDKRFSVFRVKERGGICFMLSEGANRDELYAVRSVQNFMQKLGPSWFADVLCPDKAISQEQYERFTAEFLRGSKRVTGVFDVDVDNECFSTLKVKSGWQSYRMNDIRAAVSLAMENGFGDRNGCMEIYSGQLDGKELREGARDIFIRGDRPFQPDNLHFSDEVEQMNHLLNFYVDADFDVDGIFGTHVDTDENDDWLNVYANYDMERGEVCDTLEICLVRGGSIDLDCQYRLTPEECAALLPKMDGYCKDRMGLSLEEIRAQYLAEQEPPQMQPTM